MGYKVQMMACGSRHTVALLCSGEVYAWGDRENGVCGVGEVNDHQYLPRLVASLKGGCGGVNEEGSERGMDVGRRWW